MTDFFAMPVDEAAMIVAKHVPSRGNHRKEDSDLTLIISERRI